MSRNGAVGSAAVCTVALCIGGLLGPPGAALALLAVPLPGLVLGGVLGAWETALSSIAGGLLVGGILGGHTAAYFVALVGVPAVVAVHTLRRACRIEAVLGATLASLLVALGLLLWVSAGDWISVEAAIAAAFADGFDSGIIFYRDLGMSAERLSDLELRRDELASGLLSLFPALVVVASGAVWLINLRLSSRWAAWPQLAGLAHWQSPPWSIWVLIVSGFAMFAALPTLALVARNVFVVTLACYFCQGLAIVSYFLQRFRLPRGLRIATYLLIAFQQIVAGLVLALGVFDLWGNFRQLGVRPADASTGSDPD